MRWTVLSVLALIMLAYLVIGGLVFSELESTEEVKTRSDLKNKTLKFIESNPCVDPDDVVDLIKSVVEAYHVGVIGGDVNSSTDSKNWDYASSVFFASTVVTTIGYGHLSPSTSGGRTFCVFYALFGIPMMLILLAGIGEKLHSVAQNIEKVKYCKDSPRKGKYLKILLIITIGYPVFVLIPSIIFSSFEDWTFGESVYYCMITLTTIGFGDFVAGTDGPYNYRRIYRVSLIFWTVIGLSWLSLVIGSIQDFAQSVVDKTGALELTEREKPDEKIMAENNDKSGLNGTRETKENLAFAPLSTVEEGNCDIKL